MHQALSTEQCPQIYQPFSNTKFITAFNYKLPNSNSNNNTSIIDHMGGKELETVHFYIMFN